MNKLSNYKQWDLDPSFCLTLNMLVSFICCTALTLLWAYYIIVCLLLNKELNYKAIVMSLVVSTSDPLVKSKSLGTQCIISCNICHSCVHPSICCVQYCRSRMRFYSGTIACTIAHKGWTHMQFSHCEQYCTQCCTMCPGLNFS